MTDLQIRKIHHLEDEQKEELFSHIYDKLPEGGLFINYDQFCARTEEMNRWYNSYWENVVMETDLTENDLELWKKRRRFDRECAVEDEVKMLENCKFKTVNCVYSNQKFSVLVARK